MYSKLDTYYNSQPSPDVFSIAPINKWGLKPANDYQFNSARGTLEALTPSAYDSPRAVRSGLDIPSQVAGINESNVYTEPSLNEYNAGGSTEHPSEYYAKWKFLLAQNYGRDLGARYRTNTGQIVYYIDKKIAAPFYSPAFQVPSESVGEDYIDPMGSFKPHYSYKMISPQTFSCLSWINDSAFQREDISALQRATFNQQRSEPFLS